MALHHMLRAAAQQQAAGPSDPYFYDVSLLLTGDGTNGAQNNTFLDSSTNNFTITRNGNATQGTFSPYGNLWSNYFDGSGDYLTAPDNAAYTMGSGDFTVETWVFSTGTGAQCICGQGNSGGSVASRSFLFYANNGSGYPSISIGVGTNAYAATSSTLLSANVWNHIAAVRNGSTVYLYLNGTQVGTVAISTNSMNDATTPFTIGRSGDYAGEYFIGYISNIRVVKGTAIYTSSFTPSTTPLTAVSGTSLLTCQSNRFIDNSSNNFAITANGDTKAQRFSPFNPTAAYSTSTIGGSGYFDGSGDKITAPSSTAFNFGTGDFTIEMWAYANATIPTYSNAFFLMDARTSASWYIFLASNALYFGDSAGTEHNGGSLVPFAWNHLVVSRVSGTTKGFVNGVQAFSFSDSGNYTGSPVVTIGGRYTLTTADLNGYMSDVRIVKGSGVSSVTVPTAPLTAITNTQLLCSFTNAGIPDAAMINDLETVGNAQVSTSVKKYGTGSLAFDGTGDYLVMPASPNLAFGTGNFTIECWLYLTATGSNDGVIIELRSTGATANGFVFNTRQSGGNYVLNFYTDGAANLGSTTLSYNTWNHVAVTRSGTTVKLFSNGVVSATFTKSNNFSDTPAPTIGQSTLYSNSNITGYIDDLRITKGYARYTANFTPPTAALPVY